MKRRATKIQPGMTVQTHDQAVRIDEARNVGGMMCFRGTVAGLANPVAFTAHPSDVFTITR